MPNTNIFARFSPALTIAVPLILISGAISAAPQTVEQDAASEQTIDEIVIVAHKVAHSVRDIA